MSWDEILKGTKGDDLITGGSGDDYLQGRAGGDTLDGGAGNDQIHGDDGDDHLRGGEGDDFINGGIGFDTAYYSGSVFEYSYTTDGTNSYVSHTGGSGIDGNDWLQHVERLVFADAIIDLTQNNAPIAFDDTAATDEDVGTYSSGSASVLDNDFDWEGDAMSVTPGTFNGVHGTLVLNADGTYTYTPYASTQALDDGETVQDSFSYTVSDGSLSDTGTLTITIAGLNDAPVANDDTASTSEDASVSGNVLANDTDVDGETLTVANAGAYVGSYGTLTLAADGSYTYTPNAAAQALDDGEQAQDVFSYTATDGTASDTATLTVTVNGLNDAPVANDDTASTTEDSSVSGNVLANDTDVDVEALTVTNPGTYVGTYGTLVLAADGSYTYTPNAGAQALDDGEVVSDAFSYTASDGTASDTATLTVNVAGLNDAPVANDDTDSTSEDSAVSGNVLTNDTDVDGETLTVTNPGTYVGAYGTLMLAADGSYTFTPNAAANGLAAGESAQDVFSYTASDGTASDSATLTVTINGANDAPTIDAGSTDASGSVTELPNNDPNENSATHTDSGTIAFDDADVTDTHTASFTPQGGGYLGSFTLDPVDDLNDTVGWDFSVSDADLDSLDEGETVTQTYTIEIDDGNGGTTTQDVTITITGAADTVPPDGTNWYIDNSAVGSANTGSPSDPFTSIAAFNAAQGTPGGPGVGDNVFLLTGTGTGIYAEADGINLLDGQTLTGVATGAVRPTITATAGDGIDVAENNTISGVDVGTVSGIGIDDDGGTVGTLTVTDVGIASGGGQIVDIDNGGTLAVTLNSAASTGSTGGAIDLAGVSGSFTVSGATSIVGVHSGGGVDVTGSSASVSLSGGGTISTGANTAVNFTGNTGSLALGGGLDIVTTSGAGLNASGGGTVTVTGAGNSVTSTTGTAVMISGTTIGAAGVTLESVSSNGAVNGIVLNNTGSLGGFTVTGTGVAGSGGTIQGSTGSAILLTDTQDVSLSWMAILNTAHHGILATNLRGDNAVSDSLISGFGSDATFTRDGIRIVNNNTNMDSFVVTNSTFSNGATANDAVFMEAQGSSTMVLKVFTSTFTGLFGDGVQVNSISTSTGIVEATIQNSQFVTAATNGNNGVSLNSLGSGTMRALIDGNTFDDVMRPSTNVGAVNATNGGGATAHITITDNVIEDLPGGRGISFSADGTSSSFVLIDGNSVDRLGSTTKIGINANFAGSAQGDVTITDNSIGQNGNLWTAGNGNANAVLVNAANTAQVDVLIDNNLVTANSNLEVVRVRSINGAVMNATVSNNTIQDTAGGDLEFDASAGLSTGTAILNLNIFANLFTETDADVIRLNDAAGGVLNVVQTSAADVSAQNDAATVTVLGTVVFAAPPPPVPITPDMPMM